MGSLDEQVAIVTGAGQGVGQGIALALANAGAAVVVAERVEATRHETCRQIEARGGRALPVACDVCSPADIAATVDLTLRAFGRIDILVNNAQIVHRGPLERLDDAAFDETFDSGPRATFRFMKAVPPHMKARGRGAIVNLATSGAVRWDAVGYGVYAAAKQAIRALSRAAAHEWVRDGIRVNTIAPIAMTPAMAQWMEEDPEGSRAFIDSLPTRRIGDPELDIGRAVVFLVGPDAGYVNAVTLPLDGGQAYFG
ncbi:MAG: SDR family oxidoreductase [Deltaproteobacteria bacterium]|nr:SDR family oxidoreductase [Deltaproteobacteria bacterium]